MAIKGIIKITLVVLYISVCAAASAQEKGDAEPVFRKGAEAGEKSLKVEIAELVKKLGSDDWRVREEAMERLYEIGEPAVEAMAAAWNTDDIEVKVRAERFLDKYHWVSPEDASQIEDLISLYIKEKKSETVVSQKEIDDLIMQLKSGDEKLSAEASKKLVEAGEQALDEVTKLLRNQEKGVKEEAEKIKTAILTNMQEFESKILDGIAKIKYSAFYLLDKLEPGAEEPGRQSVIGELLSGINGLKKPNISVTTGKVVINGMEFMRPPGGLKVSDLGNGIVTINDKAVPIPGRIIKDIETGELLSNIISKRQVNSEIKARALEMASNYEIKDLPRVLMNAARELKPGKKEEDRNLLTTILRILPTITEGGPSIPLAGKDAKELKTAFQAWFKWWNGKNNSSSNDRLERMRRAWKKNK